MRHHIHVDALLYPWPERTKTGKIRIELYGGLAVSNFIDECDPLDCTPSGIKQGLDAGTDAGRNVVMEAATTRRRIRTMTHDIYKAISRVGK